MAGALRLGVQEGGWEDEAGEEEGWLERAVRRDFYGEGEEDGQNEGAEFDASVCVSEKQQREERLRKPFWWQKLRRSQEEEEEEEEEGKSAEEERQVRWEQEVDKEEEVRRRREEDTLFPMSL